ncbi:carboxymuconolactone decarboxylase family protein [Helicobacter cinaedi]|uniref:carboxymuconolactone decarboxylase family protein n=1 Tax=Helicobacter cinaedi TaxID=213 RepID=UPI000D7BDE9E|nr:carboxymuconolactone decarboxylase family protein [Helicobacter cinaedi]
MKTKQNRRDFLQKVSIGAGALLMGDIVFAENIHKKKEIKMQLTQRAKEHFAQLFLDMDIADDAEFFEIFMNFALDEAFLESKLELQDYIKLTLAALIATQSLEMYKTMLQAALKNSIKPIVIKEIIYQAVPYVGFGQVSAFISITNSIFTAHNITLPLESKRTTTRKNRQEKGLNIQRQIFGATIDKANAQAPQDEKHIKRFLSANCFGDYYTRDGIELQFRELLTFVYIAALGGAESQLKAHISGNLAMGNNRERLLGVITALVPYIGYPKSLNAIAALDSITLKG